MRCQPEKSFGPGHPPDTVWLARRVQRLWTHHDLLEERECVGPTAFLALASIGWCLGEIRDVNPVRRLCDGRGESCIGCADCNGRGEISK